MAVTHLHRFRADAKKLREAGGGGGMAEGCGINFGHWNYSSAPLPPPFFFLQLSHFLSNLQQTTQIPKPPSSSQNQERRGKR